MLLHKCLRKDEIKIDNDDNKENNVLIITIIMVIEIATNSKHNYMEMISIAIIAMKVIIL